MGYSTLFQRHREKKYQQVKDWVEDDGGVSDHTAQSISDDSQEDDRDDLSASSEEEASVTTPRETRKSQPIPSANHANDTATTHDATPACGSDGFQQELMKAMKQKLEAEKDAQSSASKNRHRKARGRRQRQQRMSRAPLSAKRQVRFDNAAVSSDDQRSSSQESKEPNQSWLAKISSRMTDIKSRRDASFFKVTSILGRMTSGSSSLSSHQGRASPESVTDDVIQSALQQDGAMGENEAAVEGNESGSSLEKMPQTKISVVQTSFTDQSRYRSKATRKTDPYLEHELYTGSLLSSYESGTFDDDSDYSGSSISDESDNDEDDDDEGDDDYEYEALGLDVLEPMLTARDRQTQRIDGWLTLRSNLQQSTKAIESVRTKRGERASRTFKYALTNQYFEIPTSILQEVDECQNDDSDLDTVIIQRLESDLMDIHNMMEQARIEQELLRVSDVPYQQLLAKLESLRKTWRIRDREIRIEKKSIKRERRLIIKTMKDVDRYNRANDDNIRRFESGYTSPLAYCMDATCAKACDIFVDRDFGMALMFGSVPEIDFEYGSDNRDEDFEIRSIILNRLGGPDQDVEISKRIQTCMRHIEDAMDQAETEQTQGKVSSLPHVQLKEMFVSVHKMLQVKENSIQLERQSIQEERRLMAKNVENARTQNRAKGEKLQTYRSTYSSPLAYCMDAIFVEAFSVLVDQDFGLSRLFGYVGGGPNALDAGGGEMDVQTTLEKEKEEEERRQREVALEARQKFEKAEKEKRKQVQEIEEENLREALEAVIVLENAIAKAETELQAARKAERKAKLKRKKLRKAERKRKRAQAEEENRQVIKTPFLWSKRWQTLM